MRAIMLVLGLLVVAPVQAAEWKPALATAVGQSWDILSTVRFYHNGSSCHEASSYYTKPGAWPSDPPTYRVWRASLVGAGLTSAIALLGPVSASHPRWHRVVQWSGYGMGALGAGNAIRNVANCGW